MKNILIFGGTGQLGVSLCRRLSRDFTLTVLTRNTHQKAYRLKTSANAGYLSIVEGSIFDENKIRDLVSKANQQEVPETPKLKDPKDFSIIGKNVKRKDTKAKINGSADYALDIKLDDMAYATVVHSPIFGGKVKSFDEKSLKEISGVSKVFKIESGIAIVGDSTWSVLKASKAIKINWSEGKAKGLDSNKITSDLMEASKRKGGVVRKEGNVKKALRSTFNCGYNA